MPRNDENKHVRLQSPNGIKLRLMKVSEKWVKVDISPRRFYGKNSSKRRPLKERECATLEDSTSLEDQGSLLEKTHLEEKTFLEEKTPVKEDGVQDSKRFFDSFPLSKEKFPIEEEAMEEEKVSLEEKVLIKDVMSMKEEAKSEIIDQIPLAQTHLEPIHESADADSIADVNAAADGVFVSERALMQDLEAIPMVVLENLTARTLKRAQKAYMLVSEGGFLHLVCCRGSCAGANIILSIGNEQGFLQVGICKIFKRMTIAELVSLAAGFEFAKK